jgi:hypothetical protein
MKPTQQPTETDFIKAAVVIDCEGNIAINYSPKSRGHAVHVTVGNTNFDLLDWCVARFGGAIYEVFPKKKRGPEFAHAKRWRIQNQEAAEFLMKCLPHFIIKKRQAEIAIKCEGTYKKRGERINEGDRLHRERLRKELLSLTKRGKKTTPEAIKVREEENLFTKRLVN